MSDIKLFKITPVGVSEMPGHSVAIEKSLQSLIEQHLEAFLGVRFLASEYVTGKTHGGRIDTLGIDENHCPVIVEYKRSLNENVINQGLYYLDWLLDHKAEFTLRVMEKFGKGESDAIEWSAPRLLCIAGDFTKFDEHAVQQINRNIDLIRYRRHGEDLLLLELVNASTAQPNDQAPAAMVFSKLNTGTSNQKTVTERLAQSNTALTDLYEAVKAYLLALGDDVQLNTLKYYVAFKRIKNFACIEVHPQASRLVAYLKVNPDTETLETGYTRDVRNVGHYGTGELEVIIDSLDDFERAKPLFLKSYEAS